MKSVMLQQFSQIPRADIPRSSFNRSHGYKTTFDAGQLVPVFVDEVLPGDTFNLRMNVFARLATPLTPFMDNLFLDSHFFFVPYRLLWTNWEKFNGEQVNPGDSTDFLIPQVAMPVGGYPENTLMDYFGVPVNVSGFNVSALPSRAYGLIWNEWFRDENLQNSLTVSLADGPDTTTNQAIQRRGKRHDYFTSCLPWPQKGPSSLVPTASTSSTLTVNRTTNAAGWIGYNAGTNTLAAASGISINGGLGQVRNDANTIQYSFDPSAGLNVVVPSTIMGTINQLRQAVQVQRLYERDARGGTRYTEILRAHFGVVSPDARLQRPEYLGGGTSPVNLHPVAQTSEEGTTPQANLAAFGTVSASGHGFTKAFTEHGVVIGLVSVRADLNYQQGLERFWSRRSRWDFYWPALSHLGEQAVLNKEIYTQGTADDDLVFGYQERYAEYRYKPSTITGLFRSQATGSLDFWHLAQDFTALPVLNSTFIQENPPIDRVIAVPAEPHFLFDSFFNFKCARPMPAFSVPGMMDHF